MKFVTLLLTFVPSLPLFLPSSFPLSLPPSQSFCSALSQELTEYYRLIAVLEAQQAQGVVQGTGGEGTGSLTLRRLVVWTHDPLKRLKILGILVDGCKRKWTTAEQSAGTFM